MMQEILQRGPIACTVAVTDEFVAYSGGIFKDESGKVSLDHSIVVAGWGEEDGVLYWIGRNSCTYIYAMGAFSSLYLCDLRQ